MGRMDGRAAAMHKHLRVAASPGSPETGPLDPALGGLAIPLDPLQLMPLLAAPFIGSFIATLAIRLPQGVPVLWARSACDHCGTALRPLELVPVLSWAVLGGKCRHCGGAIARIHPVTELASLLLALWAVLAVPPELAPATSVLGWVLLAIALIDLRHFIIPDVLTV